MSSLPSGTVAFLFTDIEGSTPLWERHPKAMGPAINRYFQILGESIAAHGGHFYKTVGDAVMAAFPTAPRALAAAVDGQRALAAGEWPETGSLRVRMAVHIGEATPVDNDYLVAPCLNRLSRLLDTGHGGQVLLTEAVHQLVRDSMPDGVALRGLGAHRLPDLLHPEQVSQVLIPGLPNDFPLLRSLERHRTNLPIQPNPLIGREQELTRIGELLARAETRLVTLTGAGGTGKTRLALQVAAEALERFEDGAFLVDLSALIDPDLVLPTVATTLGVRESGEQSLRDALVAYLSGKQLLLVLDNFEQVLDAAPTVTNLLAACAGITVLVTSRARLGVRGEHVVRIQPLPLPPPPPPPTTLGQLSQYASVQLFIERASDARDGFAADNVTAPAIAEICIRLDGLPLAIELAAARVRVLSPDDILARLGRRLPLLIGGLQDQATRQRTMQATIAWSYDLLKPDEQRLFRRLAVFAGGFTLDAAERVVSTAGDLELSTLEGVTALIDQSLIRFVEGESRYVMLETLREFGLEQLETTGEAKATREAHAAWCLALAEEAAPKLTSVEQATWFERLEIEHDNMRAALSWAAAGLDWAEMGLRLAAKLWRFWYVRGHFSEGRDWLRQSLAKADLGPSTIRAIAVNGAGNLARIQGDYVEAAALLETRRKMCAALGDQQGVATSLGNLGLVAQAQGDYRKAAEFHEESLAIKRELGDQSGIAASLGNLGIIAHEQGDYDSAAEFHEESLAIKRELNDTNPRSISISLDHLGLVAEAQGNSVQAANLYEACLESRQLMKNPRSIALSLQSIARLSNFVNDPILGTRLMAAASVIRDRIGAPDVLHAQTRNERFLKEAKDKLGESAFTEGWEAGRQLSMEEAIEEAVTVLRLVHQHGDAGNGATPASAADGG